MSSLAWSTMFGIQSLLACRERCPTGSVSLRRSVGFSRSRYTLSCLSPIARTKVVLPTWRGPSKATAGKISSRR